MHRWLLMAAPALLAMECGGGLVPRDPVEPPAGGYSAGYLRAYNRVVENSEEALAQLQDRSGVGPAEVARAAALVREATSTLRGMGVLVDESAEPLVREIAAGYDECTTRLERRHDTRDTARMLGELLTRVRNELTPGKVPIALTRRFEPPSEPQVSPVPIPPQPPPEPGPVIRAPAEVFFLAWRSAHQDLARAVHDGQDAQGPYGLVADVLRRLREALPSGEGSRLDPYVEQYRRLWERTLGFRMYSLEFSRADAVAELDRIRQAVEACVPVP